MGDGAGLGKILIAPPVRYWHLADIRVYAAHVRFWRGKADAIQGKADIKKCPLMTQSGHERVTALIKSNGNA